MATVMQSPGESLEAPERKHPVYCPYGHNVVWTTAEWDECGACGSIMTEADEESYCCSLTSAGFW